jgi:drug/metabolite transporter (DMT)-like permease
MAGSRGFVHNRHSSVTRTAAMPSFLRNPYLLLTLTSLFWSGNMVLGRGIRADIPPLTLAFWRWLIAFALVLPFALPHLRSQWPALKKGWKAILVLGLLGVGGYNTFAYIALQYTAATNAVLLNSFIPIATMAIAWAFLGRSLRPRQGVGVLLSFIGVAAIICQGDPSRLADLGFNRGDLWMLAAVAVWALYTVGLQWRPAGVDPMLMLAALTAVGLLVLTPAYLWELNSGRSMHVHLGSLLSLAYVGIFPGFIGYVFYNRGVLEVGPGQASLFLHLMPVFGTLLSAIFLGEIPHAYHYVGIALIFSGIGLTTIGVRRG